LWTQWTCMAAFFRSFGPQAGRHLWFPRILTQRTVAGLTYQLFSGQNQRRKLHFPESLVVWCFILFYFLLAGKEHLKLVNFSRFKIMWSLPPKICQRKKVWYWWFSRCPVSSISSFNFFMSFIELIGSISRAFMYVAFDPSGFIPKLARIVALLKWCLFLLRNGTPVWEVSTVEEEKIYRGDRWCANTDKDEEELFRISVRFSFYSIGISPTGCWQEIIKSTGFSLFSKMTFEMSCWE